MVRSAAWYPRAGLLLLCLACGQSEARDRPRAGQGGSGGEGVSGRAGTGGADDLGQAGSAEAGAPGDAGTAGAGGLSNAGTGGQSSSGAGGTPVGGTTGNTAGASGAAGDAPGTAAGPGWIPTGEFGAAADELIAAARDLCEALCISGLCDELTPEALERCVQAEFQNFAPSVQWIACTVHTSGDHDLDELASYYRAWARETRSSDCHLVLPPVAPELGECAARSAYRIPCPGTESTLNFCDGEAQCADGYDERNCDPAAEAYACGGGEQVEWDALCDGESDCPDGDDEHACEER